MLKMFSTQLTGLFNRLQEKEEFSIEDGARLLAQAAAGEGTVYIYGTKEMQAVALEAVYGEEPLQSAAIFTEEVDLEAADRVLIVSRYADDKEAVEAARGLQEKGIPFVSISTIRDDQEAESLDTMADVHIDLRIKKGLLPDEMGNRVGYPTSIVALFIYFGLKFTIEEILEEY
ncbi:MULTISPECIES: DUF2529 domain-containing protein [Mesobacillus]|uniref:DUF2529 domain-containing protein n=1 Tax=Mesobacillus TaxID=2675231 RepID=UPI00177CEBEB|nr:MULTISPECIES: DUF2529 domain-containing protein [Mesobacillus]MCM3574530.1 DUF2529 domain-containing protein [Mesobacillus subterraneus]UYZ21904.1 DUF2529 domain-containing protein [Mesobacillus jeotgali]